MFGNNGNKCSGVQRIRAEVRARIAGILRADQKEAYARLVRELGARTAPATGRVWILARGGAPAPVELRLGLSDGASTEVLDGPLAEGAEVVVGTAPGADGRGGLPRLRLF